jgi:hypothetical protein
MFSNANSIAQGRSAIEQIEAVIQGKTQEAIDGALLKNIQAGKDELVKVFEFAETEFETLLASGGPRGQFSTSPSLSGNFASRLGHAYDAVHTLATDLKTYSTRVSLWFTIHSLFLSFTFAIFLFYRPMLFKVDLAILKEVPTLN